MEGREEGRDVGEGVQGGWVVGDDLVDGGGWKGERVGVQGGAEGGGG